MVNKQISIAPMMGYTHRHFRFFMRLVAPRAKLFTEMVVANGLFYQNKDKLLNFNSAEHPIALQLGGSNPEYLARAAKIAEDYGYDEINLNVGCPSDRVQKAKIGACLMLEPDLVAECVTAMKNVVNIPVTVKTRLGVDNHDSYEFLCDFIKKMIAVNADEIILHARKAWLNGVNPKKNRTIPNLNYERVYQIKQDFTNIPIIINGGITDLNTAKENLQHTDGVMIGRAAVDNSYFIAELCAEIFGNKLNSRKNIFESYKQYINQEAKNNSNLSYLFSPLMGLYNGQAGAKKWREAVASKNLKKIEELDFLN